MMTPDLSVIIPVYNGEKTLSLCLEAVFRSDDVNTEVIVVDDASTDLTREIAAQYPVKLISLSKRVGAGAARNPGAEIAKASILVHTDADVQVFPDTFRLILNAFEEDPGLDALFGSYSRDCPVKNFFSQYKNLHHHFIHHISSRQTNSFWSGCGAVRKDAFWAVGGFKAMKFMHDVDLGYRLDSAGCKIELMPHIQARHHKHYTFLSLVRSDLRGRAVPWTQIMWQHGIFKSDLNTRKSDSASVGLLFMALLMLMLPIPVTVRAAGLLVALGMMTLLNLDWWRICCRHGGWRFAARAMAMEWCYFFICGAGAIGGTFLYFKESIQRSLGWPATPDD